jgi:hypothetical protein
MSSAMRSNLPNQSRHGRSDPIERAHGLSTTAVQHNAYDSHEWQVLCSTVRLQFRAPVDGLMPGGVLTGNGSKLYHKKLLGYFFTVSLVRHPL